MSKSLIRFSRVAGPLLFALLLAAGCTASSANTRPDDSADTQAEQSEQQSGEKGKKYKEGNQNKEGKQGKKCEKCGKGKKAKAARELHPEPVVVQMQGGDEADMGTVTLTDTPNGLLVEIDLQGLPEGTHAFHFHETGACEGEFHSAGGHFNPRGKKHGIKAEEGMHAGDLPNIHVPANGKVRVDVFAPKLYLSGGRSALLDDDGAAIIIHAGADDYISDPTGNAGARLACGVVRE